MNAYIDSDAYNKAYMKIDRSELGRDASFQEFYKLRHKFLTNKYRFQDYGLSFIILGLFLVWLTRNGWRQISAFKATWKIVLLGLSAASLTAAGSVGDLILEFARGAYPYWADSLGIPLSGVPTLFVLCIGWAAVNMMGLNGDYVAGATISGMGIRNVNWWYGCLSIITIIVLMLVLHDGCFWSLLPGLLWLYFYLSIMAGRKAAYLSK